MQAYHCLTPLSHITWILSIVDVFSLIPDAIHHRSCNIKKWCFSHHTIKNSGIRVIKPSRVIKMVISMVMNWISESEVINWK